MFEVPFESYERLLLKPLVGFFKIPQLTDIVSTSHFDNEGVCMFSQRIDFLTEVI